MFLYNISFDEANRNLSRNDNSGTTFRGLMPVKSLQNFPMLPNKEGSGREVLLPRLRDRLSNQTNESVYSKAIKVNTSLSNNIVINILIERIKSVLEEDLAHYPGKKEILDKLEKCSRVTTSFSFLTE